MKRQKKKYSISTTSANAFAISMSDDCLEIILPGHLPSKKNSQVACRIGGIQRIVAPKYESWKRALTEAVFPFESWPEVPMSWYPVSISCTYMRQSLNAFDYANVLQSIQDWLVEKGIIVGDDVLHLQVGSQGCGYDPEAPRTIVRLSPGEHVGDTRGFVMEHYIMKEDNAAKAQRSAERKAKKQQEEL